MLKSKRPQCATLSFSVPSQVCYERLQKRGRPEESTVTLEYLQHLHHRHEEWLTNKSFK